MSGRRLASRRSGYWPGQRRSAPADYSRLLTNTNHLLQAAGLTKMKIVEIGELKRVASSMFVAVYESLFRERVDGIIREPKTKEDYVSNVQRVIDALGVHIQMDLEHIRGSSIVEGDPKTLSNLVHIFIRIIAITGSQESQSTEEEPTFIDDQQQGVPAAAMGDGHEGDSISTHESTFAQEAPGGLPRSRPGIMEKALGMKSDSEVRKLCEQDARQLLLTTEIQIKQAERAEAARLRRATIMHAREIRCEMENRKCEERTKRMMQQRWMDECERAATSYKERQGSEQQTMLRQVYRGLLKKLFAWRRAEKSEAQDNVSKMRDDAKKNILSLQALFEDRVKLLQEQTSTRRQNTIIYERAQRQQGSRYKRMYEGDHLRELGTQKNQLAQKRQAQLLKEFEGHRHLLSLLSVEKWESSLRG